MRPGAEFVTMIHAAGAAPMAAPVHGLINGTAVAAHSPWQSPVPYLFGGLAAMLGLIAFALLILACSYWKLSGYLDAGAEDGRAGDGAGGEKGSASGAARPAADFLEHVVVIMAGDERPTFLAKPATSRAAVEVELAAATASATSANTAGHGQDKKADASEVSSTQLGADAVEDAGGSHRDHHQDDASIRSLEDDAAIRSQSRDSHHYQQQHHDDEISSSSSGTTALQQSSQ